MKEDIEDILKEEEEEEKVKDENLDSGDEENRDNSQDENQDGDEENRDNSQDENQDGDETRVRMRIKMVMKRTETRVGRLETRVQIVRIKAIVQISWLQQKSTANYVKQLINSIT